jgi:hypothetical protein
VAREHHQHQQQHVSTTPTSTKPLARWGGRVHYEREQAVPVGCAMGGSKEREERATQVHCMTGGSEEQASKRHTMMRRGVGESSEMD